MRPLFLILIMVVVTTMIYSFTDGQRPQPHNRNQEGRRRVDQETLGDRHTRKRPNRRRPQIEVDTHEDDDREHHEHQDREESNEKHHHHHHHNRPDHHHSHSEERHHGHHYDSHDEHKIFTFQVGNDFGPYEYVDHNGNLKGFYIDLIKAVCEEAEHKCEAVYDEPENCWISNGESNIEKPGIGLMTGWYDGCMGYSQSPDRLNSVAFSKPFTTNHKPALFSLNSFSDCNPMNLQGLKIGIVGGWSVGKRCLSRQFNVTGNHGGDNGYISHIYYRHEEMMAALMINEIDAVFTVDDYVPESLNLHRMCDSYFQCTTAGISLMIKKDSNVGIWWNDAFTRLVQNGKFTELCEEGNRKHSIRGNIDCVQP